MLTNRMLPGLIGVCAFVLALCLPSWAQNALDKPGTKAGETATGPDGGVYVWVPAGEFMMGSTKADVDYAVQTLNGKPEWFSDEQPAHRVRITKGFWLGKCTVTLGQWKAYCGKTGAEVGEALAPGDNHPVLNVSWDDVSGYCRTYGLALPTEAQWEYAARGPEGRRFPWGNEWDPKKCCNSANVGPEGQTFPIGSFPEGASWCGALDMAGNVFQWCKDWLDEEYYASSPGADPPGPDSGVFHELRGGSFGGGAVLCRSSFRSIHVSSSSGRSKGAGFRACRMP